MSAANDVQPLFEAVRAACSTATWSRGVELVRAEAVAGERDDGNEIALRVTTRGGLICPGVLLFPGGEEWDCDCSSREDVCEHVAAAVIALRRARNEGHAMPGPDPETAPGRIGYRFTREGKSLALSRVIAGPGGDQPLRSTLTAITSGRIDGPEFIATPVDLAAESTLGARGGVLPRGLLPKLLDALSEAGDVTLDERPIRTSGERVLPRVRVEDAEGGFQVRMARDLAVSEIFTHDIALRGDTLQPMGRPSLTGRELDQLRGGRFVPAGEVAVLVTEILPSLEGRVPIDIETTRLPKTADLTPRLCLETRRDADALSVLPTLVYGDPAVARVDAGKLVCFGESVPLRDLDSEAALGRRLQSQLHLQLGHRVTLRGEAAIDLADKLAGFSGEIRGDAHTRFFRAAELVPSLSIRGREIDLGFAARATGDADVEPTLQADPAAVLRAWRDGLDLAPLEGGGLAPLPADWLDRFGREISDLLAARSESGELSVAMVPDLTRLARELGEPDPPDFEALRTALGEGDDLPAAELPSDLAATLRDYQVRGVDWLCVLRGAGLGALLADDMGLGKTVQALCALRGRSLVVAPTSVMTNWQEETARFRPGLRVGLYHGPKRVLDPDADVTLTTYAILRLDAELLAAVKWGTVVLDEAQAIKNPDSQVARAAYRLNGEFRMTLSGTPVENRLDELWSQLNFLNRGLLGGRRDFDERYAKPIERQDEDVANHLRRRIRPFVLRRLKREVAPELPPRTEVVLHPALDDAERRVYDAIRAATRTEVVEKLGKGANVMAVLEALLRLRQAACHASLVPGQSAASSSKVDLLVESLDEVVADGHKALVFSQWTSLLDLVEPHLEAENIDYLRLDGSTRDRGGVVARFQNPDGPPVLIASLKAGGLGLNLTAADHVFILDPWWNPAAEDQAADRAHRIGQDKPVLVYRLVTQDTVEERILALQQKKRQLAEAALGPAGTGSTVTREDLLALLD